MKILQKDQRTEVSSRLRGGEGDCTLLHFLTADLAAGAGRLFAVNTLEPGCSIGYHKHQGDFEVYYILEGTAHITDDGEEYDLSAGDVMLCQEGHSHGVANRGDTTLRFLAAILYPQDKG